MSEGRRWREMKKDMLEWYQLLYVSQSSALQESSDEYRGSWTLHSMTLPTNTPTSPHTPLSSGSEDVTGIDAGH